MATETIERRRKVEESVSAIPVTASDAGSLPVPDLRVKGFRGLKDLNVPRLGQVTLIAGKNGVGKTTLLEAIQVFATRFNTGTLAEILGLRREIILGIDEDGNPTVDLDWESLFWGRHVESNQNITIGSRIADIELRISLASPFDIDDDNADLFFGAMPEHALTFKIEASNGSYKYASSAPGLRRRNFRGRRAPYEVNFPAEVAVTSLGPDVVNDIELADMWDELIDSGGSKQFVLDSLSEMYGRQVDDLDMVGDRPGVGRGGRRAKVRLAEQVRPVPLKSLGDGAMRIVGHVTAVSQRSKPLVVVDEIENGIHHGIQRRFWRTLIAATARYRTQLIATTHSWDCVEAFAHAAAENEQVDCSLIRISDIDDEHWVTRYAEDDLTIAAEHGIEVR